MATFISRWFYTGKLRFLGKIGYNFIVNTELFWHRLSGHWRSLKPLNTDELTIIIKTFERPRILKRLIKSIRRFYPEIKIIVVDDSYKPTRIPGIETIVLPFDSGVSAGRNAALNAVKTKYLLLLDDDFIFFRKTILADALAIMDQNPNIDILGGKVINLPFYKSNDYRNTALFPTSAEPLRPIGEFIGGLEIMDKVANFYIGRTESIKKVGWDERLKRLDHADFFTRARGKLITVYYPNMQILHAQTLFDTHYQRYRDDDVFDKGILFKRYYQNPK